MVPQRKLALLVYPGFIFILLFCFYEGPLYLQITMAPEKNLKVQSKPPGYLFLSDVNCIRESSWDAKARFISAYLAHIKKNGIPQR